MNQAGGTGISCLTSMADENKVHSHGLQSLEGFQESEEGLEIT